MAFNVYKYFPEKFTQGGVIARLINVVGLLVWIEKRGELSIFSLRGIGGDIKIM